VIHNLEIQFYVVGGEETEISSWYKRIVVPKEEIDYPKFVKWLRKNVHFTIGVAPLTPNLLNQSKSYLKYLDYAALGIPGVYSELEPYKKVISSDFNGLLAKHSVKDWENHLKRLIMNPSLREEIIQNSYQDIVNNHLLKEHTQKWLEIISD
ncbi:MAG TPA: glycosyltransferase, partial [Bacillales bacterium]|nr:glycosyltransferase [Bacillales bacterium]